VPVRLHVEKNSERTFPPLSLRVTPGRGTRRNRWGRRVTVGAVGRLFVLVTADRRGRMGTGRDPPGDWPSHCKIAGIAYEGPPNLALAPTSVRVDRSNADRRTGCYALSDVVNCGRPVNGQGFLAGADTRPAVQSAPLRYDMAGVATIPGGRSGQERVAPPSLA
jgi:hypothetical protein